MESKFEEIALAKKVDVVYQCLCFVFMVFVVIYTDLKIFGLYIMAAGQVLSALCWLIYFQNDMPQRKFDKGLRWLFVIGGLLIVLSGMVLPVAFMCISWILLVVGPILGITYFVTSIAEARFYSKARKPYYLL